MTCQHRVTTYIPVVGGSTRMISGYAAAQLTGPVAPASAGACSRNYKQVRTHRSADRELLEYCGDGPGDDLIRMQQEGSCSGRDEQLP